MPEQQDEPPVGSIKAEFYRAGEEDENDGKRQIEFIVADSFVDEVSGPAADGRITLGLPGGG